jgi:hypothetical protein
VLQSESDQEHLSKQNTGSECNERKDILIKEIGTRSPRGRKKSGRCHAVSEMGEEWTKQR